MSDEQLRDEAMTLIFAGHETTAHALVWTWYLLAKNPDKVAKMREELQSAVGDRRLQVDDLPKLPYLEMVVKESLRLYPSVWAYARQAQRDLAKQLGISQATVSRRIAKGLDELRTAFQSGFQG